MHVQFLTHPAVRLGDLLSKSFESNGAPKELVVVSAFASLRTIRRIKPIFQEVQTSGGKARLVLGVDLGGTSKEVLQEVAGWGISVIIVKNRQIGVTFHPKVYLARWDSVAELIVGSNNLTEGGFYRNYEASTRTSFKLPKDHHLLDNARTELKQFLDPAGPVSKELTPKYLAELLALPEIPPEVVAVRRRAESIPRRPPSDVFGYETVKPGPAIAAPPGSAQPKPAKVPAKKTPPSVPTTDTLAMQVRAHHNGEIFLSVRAAYQNPAFFKWPFKGTTTPKKSGNPSYPQLLPDPVVDIVVYGADGKPVKSLFGYALNTVYYATKSEIRVTASPLVGVVEENSIMVMRRSDSADRDYDIVIHLPSSPDYPAWLAACNQEMPRGGAPVGRRFGWL